MGYAVYFDYDQVTYRLPVNPEQIEVSSSMNIETYDILKLGQVAVPTHMELKKYNFECEFPTVKRQGALQSAAVIGLKAALGTLVPGDLGVPNYVETLKEFKSASFYLDLFEVWRKKKVPVRFIAGCVNDEDKLHEDNINNLVLIEELTITEKAGEEGDKYVTFTLLEYREYGKALPKVNKVTGKKENAAAASQANPKSSGYYVVKSGDSLWTIAKKYYGDGAKCNIIYNANKDKLKNPSLIYPGQRLKIPGTDELSKFLAPLPVTKITTATKSKVTSVVTEKVTNGERALAGIALLLDSIGNTDTTEKGYTHSSGGRSF